MNDALHTPGGDETGNRGFTENLNEIKLRGMFDMVNITGDWIENLRVRMGYTQAEFAKKCGVSQNTVANWENGKRNPLGPARIVLEMIYNEAERTRPEKISA